MEKQLPGVSPEAPASVPSQLQGRPRHEGLGQLPSPGAWQLLEGEACGARCGPEQKEISADLPTMCVTAERSHTGLPSESAVWIIAACAVLGAHWHRGRTRASWEEG